MALKIDTLQCSVGVAALRDAGCGVVRPVREVWVAVPGNSSCSAEFSGRLGHEHTRKPGMTVSPGEESARDRAAVILTPDQRVRVFISSTLEELAEERAAALRAIRRLHLVPVWFESGARPHPPQSMYRAYLDQSQIFVGIYWQRYGWVGPGMEISGLEYEFRLAVGKPMLLYLKRPAPDQEPGLTTMIDGIRSAGAVSYRHFATATELERLLTDDLAVVLSESFADATGEPGVVELPAGTVTFLLTDIEGSTRLWESEPEAMGVALQRHDRLLAEVIEGHGGAVITSRGEGGLPPGSWRTSLRPRPVGRRSGSRSRSGSAYERCCAVGGGCRSRSTRAAR
jgi:hypothetical protein